MTEANLLDRVEWSEADVTIRSLTGGEYAAGRWRDLSDLEKRVSLDLIEARLNEAEEQIVAAAGDVQRRQINKLVDLAEQIVASGKMERLERVEIPYTSEMAGGVSSVLRRLYDFGAQEVKKEAARKLAVDPADKADVSHYITSRAKSLIGVLSAKLKSAFIWETLDQVRRGSFNRERLAGRLTSLSDHEVRSTASFSTAEALNMGRRSVADELGGKAIYSAILDSGTCSACSDMDGQEFDIGSTEYNDNTPPFRECAGGGRCRCLWVYVFDED